MVVVISGKCEIFIICLYEKVGTKKQGMEFIKDHDNREEFLLHGMKFYLGFSQFIRPIHNRLFVLDYSIAHVVVRSMGI